MSSSALFCILRTMGTSLRTLRYKIYLGRTNRTVSFLIRLYRYLLFFETKSCRGLVKPLPFGTIPLSNSPCISPPTVSGLRVHNSTLPSVLLVTTDFVFSIAGESSTLSLASSSFISAIKKLFSLCISNNNK